MKWGGLTGSVEASLAALVAFGLVFMAELGDRTQFVLFALATRHPRLPLFAGASLAFFLQTLLAVFIGDRVAAWLPVSIVLLLGAVVFLVLGALALKGAIWWPDEEDDTPRPPSKRGGFLTAFLFVLIAELGDKTQIAAAALAATSDAAVATFLGAMSALLASAALALLLGRWVALRLPARFTRFLVAGVFLAAGLLMVVFGLR